MEGKCRLCGESSNVETCNCPNDPISLCEKCCSQHDFIHRRQTTPNPLELYCSVHETPLVQLCVVCMSSLCEECCNGHESVCTGADTYPIEFVDLTMTGEDGINRLKRGKTIDAAIHSLRNQLTEISERTKADVEAKIATVHECLETAKIKAFTKVDEAVAQLSSDIDALEARLSPIKFTNPSAFSSEIDELLFTLPLATITSRFSSEPWLQASLNDRLLTKLSTELVTISPLTELFNEQKVACPWAGRYVLLLGNTTQFCDLEALELLNPPFSLPPSFATISSLPLFFHSPALLHISLSMIAPAFLCLTNLDPAQLIA